MSERKKPQPNRAHRGVVIYSDTHGVFLGVAANTAYWSQVQSTQETAPVFDNQDAAAAFVKKNRCMHDVDVRYVAVIPDMHHDGQRFATPQACMEAGLPGWLSVLDSGQFAMVFGTIPTIH